MMKLNQVAAWIVPFVLSVILLASIIVIYLIGFQRPMENRSSLLLKACECGCPSIEPVFDNQTNVKGKIVNGEEVRSHSWPWEMVLMVIDFHQNPVSFCGATLISNEHILTAAHCVHQYLPPFIYIFPGQDQFHWNISLTSGYRVKQVFVHEEFNIFLHHDLAILILEQPIRFDSFISPICLPNSNSNPLKVNEELVIIGRGRISSQPGTIIYPDYLHQMKIHYIPLSNPNCSQIFRPITNIHPGQMCAGKQSSHACHGDSGSPLMRRIHRENPDQSYWEQVGIASKTIDCGWNSTSPDIYINTQFYYQWIRQTIQRAHN